MAVSPLRLKSNKHIRTISLPSESHPLLRRVHKKLSKLRTLEGSTNCSSSLLSMRNKIDVLQDVYDCIDDMFLLSNTHLGFARECRDKWVEEVLDGLLSLLDGCAVSKNIISQTKEDVHGLVSMMRRRRKDVGEFGTYFASRKNVKKMIQKSLKDLKNKKTPQALVKDQEKDIVATMMKEVESITLALFQSLLSHIGGGSKSQSRWSMVSKLMQNNNTTKSCQGSVVANKFEEIDVALSTSKDIFDVQNLLGDIESKIQEIEKVLESLFKRLIKTRVSLLNMLGH